MPPIRIWLPMIRPPEYSDEMIIGAYERDAYWLGEDGKLSAHLMTFNDAAELVPSPNTPIFFLRDGRVVAQARSGADAMYSVVLAPGYYSFVVAGQQKLGAQGIIVMPPSAEEQVPTSKTKSVSFRLNARSSPLPVRTAAVRRAVTPMQGRAGRAAVPADSPGPVEQAAVQQAAAVRQGAVAPLAVPEASAAAWAVSSLQGAWWRVPQRSVVKTTPISGTTTSNSTNN